MIDKYAHTIPNKKQTILNHLEGVYNSFCKI